MRAFGSSFDKIAHWTARHAGRASTFALALAIILVWGISGPLFQWSDTWQLIINTGTTIVTFLMVFLIQNTQNRDTLALHLKLSELVFAVKGAKDKYAALETLDDKELDRIREEYKRIAEAARRDSGRSCE